MRAATAWNVLDRAGVPGITDVWCPPVQAGVNILVQIKQSYRGQAKQVANALWGSSAGHVRYKHVTVVDDDIDIHDYAAVDWAIAYRVNAGEDDIVIMPATFGLGLDPSTRKRDRNTSLYGTGKWNRMLIDATINLDYDPDPEFDGARFPPMVWPAPEDTAAAKARWSEFGLDKKKMTSCRESGAPSGILLMRFSYFYRMDYDKKYTTHKYRTAPRLGRTLNRPATSACRPAPACPRPRARSRCRRSCPSA